MGIVHSWGPCEKFGLVCPLCRNQLRTLDIGAVYSGEHFIREGIVGSEDQKEGIKW